MIDDAEKQRIVRAYLSKPGGLLNGRETIAKLMAAFLRDGVQTHPEEAETAVVGDRALLDWCRQILSGKPNAD